METEMKNKEQLQEIKGKIENILGEKVVEIDCLDDDFNLIPTYAIKVVIYNSSKGKIGFFIDSFENIDFLNNAIERTCNSLKKELM